MKNILKYIQKESFNDMVHAYVLVNSRSNESKQMEKNPNKFNDEGGVTFHFYTFLKELDSISLDPNLQSPVSI